MTSGVASTATAQNIDCRVWRKVNTANLSCSYWRLILFSTSLLVSGSKFCSRVYLSRGRSRMLAFLADLYDHVKLMWWKDTYQFLLFHTLFTSPGPKWTNTPLNIVINLSRGGPDTRLILVAECVARRMFRFVEFARGGVS